MRSVLIQFSILFLFVFFGHADIIEKTFNVNPGGTLYLNSDVGVVEIRTHGQSSVEVRIDRDARGRVSEEEFKIDMEQDGDDVRIDGYFEDRSWSSRSRIRIEYLITVPEKFNVDLHTSGGSILVDDLNGWANVHTSGGGIDLGNIEGKVEAKTSGGSIHVKDCKGDTELKTSGGSIHAGSVMGNVVAHTSGGSISAENISGELDAQTSGGSINVNDVGGTVYAKTSGGSIKASISKQPEHDGKMKTSGGNVILYLADDIGIDVYASTTGGKVYTDFDVTVRGELKKNKLDGKINGGGPEFELKTSGGNVKILKR